MKGHTKKISKMLKDLKVPVIEKRKVMVILTDNKICCVPGIRGDHRFVTDPESVNAVVVRCTK